MSAPSIARALGGAAREGKERRCRNAQRKAAGAIKSAVKRGIIAAAATEAIDDALAEFAIDLFGLRGE